MSENSNRNKARTIAVSFPHTDEGDMVYEKLMELKAIEDRSCSKIIYRLLRRELTGDEGHGHASHGFSDAPINGRASM